MSVGNGSESRPGREQTSSNEKRAMMRRSQLSLGGWRRQAPSQGKQSKVQHAKGDYVRLPPQRKSRSREALSRREAE